MNLHQQMLRKTILARQQLGDATGNVADFLNRHVHHSGGFIDRAGKPDLYYSVFGIDCMLAVEAQLSRSRTAAYLAAFGAGSELDLIHLTCLIRCAAALGDDALIQRHRQAWIDGLEMYRSQDGAYHQNHESPLGSAYACFIVMDAYQSLEQTLPRPEAMLRCIQAVDCGDGSFGLQSGDKAGTTPTTCAALLALQQLGQDLPEASHAWLRGRYSRAGGFVAGALTPVPDLLSTATALHALSLYGDICADIREDCLDFVDSLWSSRGSFCAYWDDESLDCEYTFYGLLALGHLSSAAVA